MVNPNPSTNPKGLPMTERDPLDLMDMDELCALLKVSKKFVYREVENDRFPVVRIGRSLRFFRQDVADYLRNGQNGPQSAGNDAGPPEVPGSPARALRPL